MKMPTISFMLQWLHKHTENCSTVCSMSVFAPTSGHVSCYVGSDESRQHLVFDVPESQATHGEFENNLVALYLCALEIKHREELIRADQNAAYLETLTARMLAAERERDACLAENAALKVQAEKSKPAIENWNSWADPEDSINLEPSDAATSDSGNSKKGE